MNSNDIAELAKDIITIEKELIQIDTLSKNNKIIVSNAGLYNVGKSSFFNALIDSDNTEFKVADRRETSVNKSYNWTSEIDLVDTPGIDAFNDKDKSVAIESFKRADIILFLHNINQGELVRSEIEFIEELSKLFPKEEFWKRIIFIMTRIDSKEDDPEYPKIILSIKNQISNMCNSNEFKFFEVSSEKYLEGLKEDFDILMNESNIINVREEIKEIARSLIPDKSDLIHKRKNEYLELLEEKKNNILCIKNEKLDFIMQSQNAIKNEKNSLNTLIKNLEYEWENVKNYKNSL